MFDLENWNWYPKWNFHVLFDPKIIWVIQPFILEVKIQWPQLVCFRKITIWKKKLLVLTNSFKFHSWHFWVNFAQIIQNKSSLSQLDCTVVADRWQSFYCWMTGLKNWPGANSAADATAVNRKIFYPVCVLKS